MDEQEKKVLTESINYSVNKQGWDDWGMGGVYCEDAIFIDRMSGKVQMIMDTIMINKDIEWSSDGNKLFFNGYESDPFDRYEDKLYFVVLDVKNKRYIHIYRGEAMNPRWNEDESDAIFDNALEPDSEVLALRDRNTRIKDFRMNHSVIQFENACGFMIDGKAYLAEILSPTKKYIARFFKTNDASDNNFQVGFSIFVQKGEQWISLENWQLQQTLVNGVDGFSWLDDNTIIFTFMSEGISGENRGLFTVDVEWICKHNGLI